MNTDFIQSIRSFNRLFVRTTGLLNRHIVNSGYSLTEAHILNLIMESETTTATEINTILNLDEGYLSRVISKLVKLNIITKTNSKEDKRVYLLELSIEGQEVYEQISLKSSLAVIEQYSSLSNDKLQELVESMRKIQTIIQSQ